MIVWPSALGYSSLDKQQQQGAEASTEEADLLGYGDAAPSPHKNVAAAPRRSSLSNNNKNDPRSVNRRASIGYKGEVTLVLPVTKQTVIKRQSIGFADDDNTVHSYDTYDEDDLSDEDNEILNPKRRLWFRDEEYRHIERNIRSIVRDAKDQNTEERPTWLETRGLESILDDSAQLEKATAIQSVLEDQSRQIQSGFYDEHVIANEYEYNSMAAQLQAEERAKQDEQEIQEYLAPTRKLQKKFQRRMSC